MATSLEEQCLGVCRSLSQLFQGKGRATLWTKSPAHPWGHIRTNNRSKQRDLVTYGLWEDVCPCLLQKKNQTTLAHMIRAECKTVLALNTRGWETENWSNGPVRQHRMQSSQTGNWIELIIKVFNHGRGALRKKKKPFS